jgi:hypothetical protein
MTLTKPLRDVLYEFSLAKSFPDARLVDQFVRQYPEHASEITDFAIELAIDAMEGENGSMRATEASVSPAVSRAMSRFQNRMYAVRHGEGGGSAGALESSTVQNPFAALDRTAFRRLAGGLHANILFVAKLRDRQIDPSTMTAGFRKCVATQLGVPLDLVVAHFSGPTKSQAPQFYRAEEKPVTRVRQSFEEAVRSSGLTAEQQHHLMSL